MSRLVPLCLALAGPAAWPQADAGGAAQAVLVSGERDAVVQLPPTTSTTIIGAEVIEREQARTIFDVVRNAAGVAVDGGPRATGMRFNIRGFRNNDDVVFKIDGGIKGFEKYRFGSGVFIEPELIRSITIERGPSAQAGSGAIGGAITVTTKSAVDLLAPEQRFGVLAKAGYDFNNDENLVMLAGYGRPTPDSDLLVAWVRRDGDDFTLANGLPLAASATRVDGTLIKLVTMPADDLMLELSRTAYQSGPSFTPFDTNSSNAAIGGYVHQTIDDESLNLRFSYEPMSSWLRLRGTLARETTRLDNLMRTGPGESSFTVPCTTTPCEWRADGGPTGDMNDLWNFEIWTGELFNDTRYRLGGARGVFSAGVQAVRNQRRLSRITENPLMNGPEGRYPDGYDGQQPSGTRSVFAGVLLNQLNWSDVQLNLGLRWDRYRIEAEGQAAADLRAVGEPVAYAFTRTTPSLGLSWRPQQGAWWFSYRWARSFRPPLITDYFGTGAASPCSGFFEDGVAVAPHGCGDRLAPTESLNQEVSVDWTPPRWGWGGSTQARLTLYRIDTRYLNGSSYLALRDGAIVQPFEEQRHGLEFEFNLEAPQGYLSFNASHIEATRRNTLTGASREFTAGIPGTTLNLAAGARPFGPELEFGYRLRQIFDQMVLPGATGLNTTTQYCGAVVEDGVVHAANTQQDVFAIWRPQARLQLQLGVFNLFNKHWCNNGDELGNIIGLQGPGRSVRLSATWQY